MRVADFTPATADEVRIQLEALKRDGAERLLLDLRGAAWGDPALGAKVAELFLEGGPVAKLVGPIAMGGLFTPEDLRRTLDDLLEVAQR